MYRVFGKYGEPQVFREKTKNSVDSHLHIDILEIKIIFFGILNFFDLILLASENQFLIHFLRERKLIFALEESESKNNFHSRRK